MPAMDKESASSMMVLCMTASGKVTRGAPDLPAPSELFSIYTSDSRFSGTELESIRMPMKNLKGCGSMM
jgi:hypothetical protein